MLWYYICLINICFLIKCKPQEVNNFIFLTVLFPVLHIVSNAKYTLNNYMEEEINEFSQNMFNI